MPVIRSSYTSEHRSSHTSDTGRHTSDTSRVTPATQVESHQWTQVESYQWTQVESYQWTQVESYQWTQVESYQWHKSSRTSEHRSSYQWHRSSHTRHTGRVIPVNTGRVIPVNTGRVIPVTLVGSYQWTQVVIPVTQVESYQWTQVESYQWHWLGHTSDLKTGTPVATPPGAWRDSQHWDWSVLYQYTVTGWDKKFDPQLLSLCGSTSNCLSRSVPEVH